ncbi:NUDIX hydrolase [Nocardia tengchongensis]|uniref:NUDIX hydrolase n=1 Tax=Nocardia tengchongensis TaxID=2055889 RepID=UPI0036B80DBC
MAEATGMDPKSVERWVNLGRIPRRRTAIRAKEETGLDIEITGLVGTYTDPRHVIAYSDGEVRRQFNVRFLARAIGGNLAISDESIELRFVAPTELDALDMGFG